MQKNIKQKHQNFFSQRYEDKLDLDLIDENNQEIENE